MSPATFAHLVHSLKAFAGGRVLALLEGGYFLPSLAGGTSHLGSCYFHPSLHPPRDHCSHFPFSEGAALTLRQLLGEPCPTIPEQHEPVSLEMEQSIRFLI